MLHLTRHAVIRMAERQITSAEIRAVISEGTMIKEYPDDTPYPCKLYPGFSYSRPIHVVFSELDDMYIIISAYQPDIDIWEPDFKRRK
ncbi:MAG: DUF4258 domain-containing protein [Gammaproteobacteria bacterium]|nr:DUF4258 domain-containing protein [Gammaproteobacteria bacterium]